MGLPAAGEQPHQGEQLNDSLSFCIGRVYYNYIGLLNRLLAARNLDRHLRPGMGHILFALFERDDCIIRDIRTRVQLSPSTLTAMLNRMKRAGLLTLRRDDFDGRAVRVKLTRLGRSVEPKCRALLKDLEAMLREGMSEQEVRTLNRSLTRLTASIRKHAANDHGSALKSGEGGSS